MGNYTVPEEIRKMRPAGTTVKNIKGHFYVYEYTPTSVKIKAEDGTVNWKSKTKDVQQKHSRFDIRPFRYTFRIAKTGSDALRAPPTRKKGKSPPCGGLFPFFLVRTAPP